MFSASTIGRERTVPNLGGEISNPLLRLASDSALAVNTNPVSGRRNLDFGLAHGRADVE
jgi:hypothetical protein